MLLRSVKSRYTATEMGPEKFCDAAFQDPRSGGLARELSVYEIEAEQLVQCHSEHFAGSMLDPKKGSYWDLRRLADDVQPDPLREWPFTMTAEAHRNIRFDEEEPLRRMAASLYEELQGRTVDVTKAELQGYVLERLELEDAEWVAYVEAPGTKPEWRAMRAR